MESKTIAAICTGLTPSGIGIIRISGNDSFTVARKIFRNSKNKCIEDFESHKVYYGFIFDDDVLIDEVILLSMKGPKSFTGEDVIEIQCHGGILIMKILLDVVLKNGCCVAEPGEFTKRAFLNGRIDLSKAEAVMDVISSKNEYALSNSVKHLNGKLFEKISACRSVLLHQIAFIEAALDDPEHYDIDENREELRNIIIDLISDLSLLSDSFNDGRVITEGIRSVIIGKPNVGKSSFLNLLYGSDRAIVTDVAGTTRDTLEEDIIINGITLKVYDTAGIRNSDDIVEKIGINKSYDAAKKADLIILIIDGSLVLSEEDFELFDFVKEYNKKCLIIINKSDLDQKVCKGDILSNLNTDIIEMSAKYDEGIIEFKNYITNSFVNNSLKYNDEIFISNIRHKESLDSAIDSLKCVLSDLDLFVPEDFLTINMNDAYTSLGFIIGEETSEDVINEVFSKFCMGK